MQETVMTGTLDGTDETKAAVYTLPGDDPDIARWVVDQRAEVLGALDEHGAVVVRGLVDSAQLLGEVAQALGGELLEYTERTTPRSSVQGNVYTSTEYPASQTIPQHNEMSYAHTVPELLYFACAQPSETGGATPLADSRAVVRRLPADLVARFRDRGVQYSRSYKVGMGLTWQEAFQTESRDEVEDYCRQHDMAFEWVGDDDLRTRHWRPAVAVDPVSGNEVWFNQAHVFHVSSLPETTRDAVKDMFDEPDYPRHAHYGDGAPITDEEMAVIRNAYEAVLYARPWSRGDLMIVKNLVMSHGRQPYTGARRVLVAMTGALEVTGEVDSATPPTR